MPNIPDTFLAGFVAGVFAMGAVALLILIATGLATQPKKPKKDSMPTQGGVRFM